MKKFLTVVFILIGLYFAFNYVYYYTGFYIDLHPNQPTEAFVKTDGKQIMMKKGDEWEPFEIKGVDMGTGEPGEWSTDFDIDKQTYKRWFAYISDMGANTLRIYTIQADDFYNAFYEYNSEREKKGEEPLWLLHGVWVNDYTLHSHLDAYSDDFRQAFIDECRIMVDVIHGRRKLSLGRNASAGSGTYNKNISRWVIGYILGVEWESDVVTYTNQVHEGMKPYKGDYMYATEGASPFENMLTEVGDKLIKYQTDKYKVQKLIAFSNWPTTDPFKYSTAVTMHFTKVAQIDVEHIKLTDKVITGQFASYHVYPYFPDYLLAEEQQVELLEQAKEYTDTNTYKYQEYKLSLNKAPHINEYLKEEDYTDDQGRHNSYLAYLTALNRYHTIPVIISEFGVSTGRGMAQIDENTNRNQGYMSEGNQGQALVDCYLDIKKAGCAGCCIFSWQDEWFKRTWNTMHAVDLMRTAYWSDYQTNEQYFGLLSFDPGKEKSVCYVDGDVSEWSSGDIVSQNGDLTLSFKYDEKFVYFLVKKEGLRLDTDKLYIPIDVTPKSGSNYFREMNVKFEEQSDFVMVIEGKDNSRLLVQERYEALRSTYSEEIYQKNTYIKENVPDKNSAVFVDINLPLKLTTFSGRMLSQSDSMIHPTGKLRYGNANPESEAFDSLADFCSSGDYIEIKLPWQLLNFADPSRMQIHDDYYDGNYGIEHITIKNINVGVGLGDVRIPMDSVALEGWGDHPTYHERLKKSYYVMQDLWTGKE